MRLKTIGKEIEEKLATREQKDVVKQRFEVQDAKALPPTFKLVGVSLATHLLSESDSFLLVQTMFKQPHF